MSSALQPFCSDSYSGGVPLAIIDYLKGMPWEFFPLFSDEHHG
jgi:hypothetical protein